MRNCRKARGQARCRSDRDRHHGRSGPAKGERDGRARGHDHLDFRRPSSAISGRGARIALPPSDTRSRRSACLRAVRSCRPTWRRREVPSALSLPTYTPWSAVGVQGLLTAAPVTGLRCGTGDAACMVDLAPDRARLRGWSAPAGPTGSTGTTRPRRSECGEMHASSIACFAN